MFGASKPFGGSGFGAKSTASAFGTQSTPFGASSGGLFGNKTPAPNAFGTPNFGASTPSSGLFGSASTGTNLFGSKTTQASTGFGGFGTSSTSGGLFGGGSTSVFQAPQSNSFFGSSGATAAAAGTTVKFVPPTSSEQAQKSGISLTIKTQNQCITVMEQYKTKCVEELRLEDYVAGRKTGQAATAFGSTTGGTGLFGSTQPSSSSGGGLFGSTTTSTGGGFGGFGKTSTSGGMFGQSTGGGLFGAKTTASLFGSTTTTTSAFGGFGSSAGGGLFGKSNTGGTNLFGATTTTTASTGLFGSTGGGFGATSSSGGLFGGTSAFGQPATQSTSVFGQAAAKPAFGFGTSTAGGFGATSTGGGLFGNTSSSGGLFGTTANKPTFSFGGTSGGFGVTGTTGGFGGFGAATSSAPTGGGLFGSKPTAFGTTGFGAASSSGSLFGSGGTALGGTGFGGFGATQNTGTAFGGASIGGLSSVDQSMLAALQQQQLLQQQRKALANTPFGDSPLFRNLTEPAKSKSSPSTTNTAAKELFNSSQYKVLARPTARIKPRPVSSPSLGKSHLFEGLEEEGDFSPYPLLPRKSVKKLVIKNKSHSENGSPFEEGQLKLRLRTTVDEDTSVLSNETKAPGLDDTSLSTADTTQPFINTIAEINHEESTPVMKKVKDYVITPLPISGVSISEDKVENENSINEPKSKIVLSKSEYYTKPSIQELDELLDEEKCECLVKGFTVGREGYGEVKFLGETDVYGLNIDDIVTFRRKEVEVYADDYQDKPDVGKELNKPAEITLLKVWPNDKSSHTPIKTPERLKEAGFIDRIEERTAAMDAVFIDYRPKEGAWVFKVNHFTKYGMQEEFIDDIDSRRLAGKLSLDPLGKLAESTTVDFQKDDIDITKEEIKQKLKIESFQISQDDDTHMEATADESVFDTEIEGMSESEDFLPASHQYSFVADVQPFSLQGMKSSLLYDDDDDEMASMKVKKKKKQLFSNKSLFTTSFTESAKPGSPFPKLDLTNTQAKDLNNSVFQNISFTQPPSSVENTAKFQKKNHIFQSGVLNTTTNSTNDEPDDSTQIIKPTDDKLSIKCQNFQMVPYEQSFLFAKTTLHSDAALSHGREFNIRWCNNMNLVHCGKHMGTGIVSQKNIANVFTGNFISSSSMFALKNSKVLIESIDKNSSEDLKQYFQENLQISLENSVFETGTNSSLQFVRLKDGIEALSDYTVKANLYKLATVSVNFSEFQMHSCIWDLISALWGQLDEDTESLYEMHAGRRDAFSKWLSNVIDNDLKTRTDSMSKDGHLSVIFNLLSANKVREASKVACDNKDIRLTFLLSQISGDFHLKNYMRNQLSLWEERDIDTYMDIKRLKIYVLLSGLMVWRSVNSTTCINICENVDWVCALALHLWYHCAPSATINDAFVEYQKAFKGTDTYEPYAPFPSPSYLDQSSLDSKTKDVCYHILSLYCKREHSLEKMLCPKTHTSAPLDYHLSWHVHEVLHALGYEHLSEDKHYLLQHSYAAELELMGLWHWSVFILMHLLDDTLRERCVKELLNRYCRVSENEDNILALTEEENTLVDKFHVPIQWLHQAKALHANSVGRYYDEALHLMRAGHWNQAHIVVMKRLTCDAIIEEDYETLKNMLNDMCLPERCCEIKDWGIGGQVYLDYICTKEKLDDMQSTNAVVSSYHLEDMEGHIASLINKISMIKTETSRERLCQSEMAKCCSSMQKFVLSYANMVDNSNDEAPKWSSLKVTPYVVNIPLPSDYYLKELHELVGNYANEMEQVDRNM